MADGVFSESDLTSVEHIAHTDFFRMSSDDIIPQRVSYLSASQRCFGGEVEKLLPLTWVENAHWPLRGVTVWLFMLLGGRGNGLYR